MGDEDLIREVLRFCPLPCLDGEGQAFLPIDECQRLLDNGHDLAKELECLRKMRDDFKEDEVQMEREKKDRKLTKGINWSKVH